VKVVLAQINPKLGDVVGNTALVLDALSRAESQRPQLVVFPELSLTGYAPRDLLGSHSLVTTNLEALNSIALAAPRNLSVILGYVDRNESSTGKPFRNAAALIRDGKIVAKYFKRLLPYYDVFEDDRYFEAGSESVVWEISGKRVGITICEDAWSEPGFIRRAYPIDPMKDLGTKQCDLVVNLSASPFQIGKLAVRLDVLKKAVGKCKAPVVYCNQVGAHDDLIFDGNSFALNRDGVPIAFGKPFESDLVGVNTDASAVAESVDKLENWTEPDWVMRALQLGIRDYFSKSGVQKAILGLSGGIDSAVVAALAVNALGKANVYGISLPSRHSSKATRADAAALAKNLGIEFHEVSMDGVYEQYRALLSPLGIHANGLIDENLQPRIRMIVLMALSQKYGALVLNTSNKSEIACGYATLYGDTAGALAVLGDLTKKRVFDLAHKLNESRQVIPPSIIDRPPSAELRPDQKDEDSLPPYAILDALVTDAVENGKDQQTLLRSFPKEHVEKFFQLYRSSEFKRQQLPPALRVTPRSFGRGRRIPLASYKPL
jgi:NAD+ synthase (glutamine-hydrolysing)